MLLTLSPAAHAAGKTIKIVATTSMIGDALSRIGGKQIELSTLMGTGIDPHTFRQTRSDIVKLTRADMVFWHDLNLEAQMRRFLKKLRRHKPVIAVTDRIGQQHLLAHELHAKQVDPHIWMAPQIWRLAIERIRDALIEFDPASTGYYQGNTKQYLKEIQALDGYAARAMRRVPKTSRILVTAHDAFRYFGRAYGFEVHGIQGISTESEAGLARVEELVDLLVDRKISAVFIESSVASRNVKALIEGCAARGHSVRIGGELFSDAMGYSGTYRGTYIGMMDHNMTTIARALGAQVSAAGMQGWLGE